MKILFVQPKAGFLMRGTTYPVCRSLMTTASYFKSLGFEVLVFDRCIDFRKSEKIIDSFKPDFVMLYVPPTASIDDAVEISKQSKSKGASVVWGEVVASALAEHIVKENIADYVITGETEEKLRLLIEAVQKSLSYNSIPGITYKHNNEIVTTENKNNVQLDVLPEIDWELINVSKCFRQFPGCKRMLYMYTSRGCPFRCGYCYNVMYYNSEHRKRNISHVLNEIKFLEEKYKLDGVNFSDELLLLSKDEIREIYDFRKNNNLNFYWGGEVRADTYKDVQMLKDMYEAGCRWLLIGIETGSLKTRKVINKQMNQEMIKEFIDKCTEVGISTFGSFIIGFPDETCEELRETVQYALGLNLDAFLFNYFVAIPKTPLGEKLILEGRLNVRQILDHESASHKIQFLTDNFSKISTKELKVVKSYFDWLTFTRKKKESELKNSFMLKALDVLKHFLEGNIIDIIHNICDALKTFSGVVYYSHAYPSIIKKYGLHNVNKISSK